jgi:ABC-type Fe3+ transport system substrate-binding protein
VKSKIVIIVVFLAVAAGIFFFTMQKKGGDGPGAPAAASGAATEITFVYSTEKKDWVESAVASYQKDHPEVKVTLVGRGSLEEAQAILDGKDKPTLWSPADSLILNMLSSDWQTQNRSDLFARAGDDAPQPLVITPMVFVIWEDRAAALLSAGGGKITWQGIHKAVASDQGWPAIGGKAEWGFVKLGHTDPTRSNSGLQALLLMTLEFHNKRSGLQVADVLDAKYQGWVKEVERGVSRFESSTGVFMTDMVRFGPSKYDVSVVYESLAISQIENAQGRWGNLKVYYPQFTVWSDHPAALLQGDWVTEPQRKAARAFLAYLHSRPVQERALSYGFRPADPAVPVKTADAQNPFTRLAQYGIQIDIPTAIDPPDGPVIRNLITMWSRVVGAR